jgi:tRNA(fMet)-specific endonuclease VapC
MLRFLLDTNICIYVLKNRPQELRERFNQRASQLCISSIVLSELMYGVEKSSRPDENMARLESFCARLEVLPYDDNAAAHFGQIRASLERKGEVIGAYDLMIAAHARSRGLTLVTNNESEFRRVEGLVVENWLRHE